MNSNNVCLKCDSFLNAQFDFVELKCWKKKFYEMHNEYILKKFGIINENYEEDNEEFDEEWVSTELEFWKKLFYQLRDEYNLYLKEN